MKVKHIRVFYEDIVHDWYTAKSWAEIKTRLTSAGLFVILIAETYSRTK